MVVVLEAKWEERRCGGVQDRVFQEARGETGAAARTKMTQHSREALHKTLLLAR